MVKQVENPATGTSYNLGKPRQLLMKVAGGVVAFTIMLWSFFLASNKGVPVMNQVVSLIPGVDLTTDSSGGNNLLGEL